MGLSVAVGSFNTGTGTSDIAVTGLGFQPSVLILHWSGRTEATDTVGAATIRQGWGFAVSTTDRRAVTATSINGAASADTGNYHADNGCVVTCASGGTIDGRADLKSWDSGGFTLSVADAFPVDLRVMYIAIGGTDITNVKSGQYTANTTTGNKGITGVGFQPDILFVMASSDNATAPPDGQSSTHGLCFGVAKSSSAQYVMAQSSDQGSANMDTASYIYSGEMRSTQGNSNPLNVHDRQALVSLDSDGFTFNQLEVPITASAYSHYLAIKGGNWAVGDLLTQTDTTTTVTETGLSFAPSALMFASVGKAISTQDVATAEVMMSFGAATSTSNRLAMAIQDDSGTASSETSTAVEYDAVYANISDADAIQGLMDVTAFNSDGFSVIMDDADPAQSYVWWVAVGPNGAAPQTVSLSASTLSASPQTATPSPGAVTPSLNVVSSTASPQSVSASEAFTVSVNASSIAAQAQQISISPGEAVSLLNASLLSSLAQTLEAVPGAVSSQLNELTLQSSPQTAVIVPGDATNSMNASSMTASPQTISEVPGEVSLALNELTLQAQPQVTDASESITATLNSSSLSASPQTATSVPGEVTSALSVSQLTVSAETISEVPGAVSSILNAATLASVTGNAVIVPGDISVLLTEAALSSLPQTVSASEAFTVSLAAAIIASSGETISITAEGAGDISVALNSAALTLAAQLSTVVPGDVSELLSVAGALVQAQNSTIEPGAVSNSLLAASIASAAQQASIQVGDISSLLGVAQIDAFPQVLTYDPGVTSIDLLSAAITSSPGQITILPGAVNVILSVATLSASGRVIGIATRVYLVYTSLLDFAVYAANALDVSSVLAVISNDIIRFSSVSDDNAIRADSANDDVTNAATNNE